MGNMSWIEVIYWAATIVGGTFFVLRTILLLAGGGMGFHGVDTHFGGDIHIDHEIPLDPAHADASLHSESDSDFSFKLLTLQGMTAFFLMFGLVGLALLRADWSIPETLAGGIIAALIAVRIMAFLFEQVGRLQSDGTMNIQNAVGQRGSVYLTIPAQGTGQVQVPVDGSLRLFDAASTGEQIIPTGEKVRVTGLADSSTLVVERISEHPDPMKV